VIDFACVVAADEQDGIGKDNDLPWPRLKADLEHFRDVTTTPVRPEPGERQRARVEGRNAVIMGRKTWESVPPRYRPLPDRLNVVVTRSATLDVPDGVIVASSLDDALERTAAADGVDGVFIIGGGDVFAQAFAHPRCATVYLTRIASTFACDAFIPDVRERFILRETLATHHDAGFDYRIERWTRQRAVD
jgi:dihydrofolate reductase